MNCESCNVIFLDQSPEPWGRGPREPSGVKGHIKHVHLNGARFHFLSWSPRGVQCSEPDCVINARDQN